MAVQKLLIFFITLFIKNILSSIDIKCENELLKKCTCGIDIYDYKEQYIVNCTDTKFSDTKMLEALPEETQVLIFTGNKISELPLNVFGQFSELKSLRVIDMSNNGIKEIRGKAYHHVTNVERLILNHNDIIISSDDLEGNHYHPRMFSNFVNLMELHLTNAFQDNTDEELSNDLHNIFVNSNLTRLMKLHLEQNEIREFMDKNVFCDLPDLRDLHLGDNLLSEIDFNLTCLNNLQFLDLERNKFRTMLLRDLIMLDRLALIPERKEKLLIDIGRNPLRCDEAWPLSHWLHVTNVEVRNKGILTCKSKHGQENVLMLEASLEKSKTQQKSETMTILMSFLGLALVSFILALIYVSRDQIRSKMIPLFDTVSRKVQYTTIESQVDNV